MAYDASVIIPCYNSTKYIFDCLSSVVSQKTSFSYEVIVVDSSEEDITPQIREKFPQVKTIHLEKRAFPGTARNAGVKNSQGEVIIFTDSDCVVAEDWVEKLVRCQKSGMRVVGGSVCNGTPNNLIGTSEYIMEMNEFLPKRPRGTLAYLITANISIHREIFKEFGYLEDSIKGSDTLFARKLYLAGEPIYFDPTIKVFHRNRTRLKQYLRNRFDLGRGSARNRKRFNLPGAFIARIPILIPFIPLFRTISISSRLLSYDRGMFLKFLLLYPLHLLGLFAYTIGFAVGMRD